MTYIRDFKSYNSLPHIFLVDKNFHYKDLGVYDPDWGVETDIAYKPGKFKNDRDETIHQDTQYEGKQSLVVAFKHMPFGNYPILRKIGRGHFHIKHFVSETAVRPHDVIAQVPETGDMFIYADIVEYPPVTIVQYDNTQETLYELRPHVSPEDMGRISHDVNFLMHIKEQLMSSTQKQQDLEAKNFILHTRNVAAESTVLQLQDHVDILLKNFQVVQDEVINMKLSLKDKLKHGLEIIEGKYNLGIPMHHVDFENTEKTAAMMQADIRAVGAMIKMSGTLSETQKQTLVLQVANVVGIDYLRKFLLGVEQYNVSTTTGQQRMTLPKNPSPTDLMIAYAQAYENNQMSAEEYSKSVRSVLEMMREGIKKGETPNSAVERTRENLITSVTPEAVRRATSNPLLT